MLAACGLAALIEYICLRLAGLIDPRIAGKDWDLRLATCGLSRICMLKAGPRAQGDYSPSPTSWM